MPVEKERLINFAILGATAVAAKRRRRTVILSIPAALSGLIARIILLTSTLVMAGTEGSLRDLTKLFSFKKSNGIYRRPSRRLPAIVEK